ncbi:MAG: TIM-barrel domain-containing protein [Wujia sp.]
MVKKYVWGQPFQTDSIVIDFETTLGNPAYGTVSTDKDFRYTIELSPEDIVYGLGESNRGINKRGYIYVSNNTDDPHHHEDKVSLYAAHNFIVVSGKINYGIFIDYPGTVTFDICYSKMNELTILCDEAELALYIIDGTDAYDIIRQFRHCIGRSYIPPKFAFGFGQSRWGYKTKQDFLDVAEGYRSNHIPLDMIYMDIDYMDHFKDFTLNEEEFSDFPEFVSQFKKNHIRLIPIIDAGVKIEKGYSVYEEGVSNNYFCKRADGSDFVAAVWPGYTHFPDVLNKECRAWFGNKYSFLIEQGIEGFWNDMNEPAIFYTPEGIEKLKIKLKEFIENDHFTVSDVWDTGGAFDTSKNSECDYSSFYHNIDGKPVPHNKVHNLYGFNMTRAAKEAFDQLAPDKRLLLFSRASFIGMHRYGGVWTGDNKSWWSHILLNLKMLPSLNMCGFLYCGADLGGFGCNTTRDLLLRWLELGVFTPLMRNHSAAGTRNQECYIFENPEDFRHVIGVRYRLLPYIYSEYMKAALNDDMLFKPLSFIYKDDEIAREIEDQLIMGNEIMIAPVYTQNSTGRYVYLPEDMMLIQFLPDGTITQEKMPKGHHFVKVPLNVVHLFIRTGYCIPVADFAECVEAIDTNSLQLIGYNGSYLLYDDDGYSNDYRHEYTNLVNQE